MLNLLKSIYAGLCIGIGGTVYLSCESKLLGSFLFGLGLFTILNFQFNLFTGKVGYLVVNKPKYLLDLAIIWIGNFIGTFACAKMIAATRYGATIQAKAQALCSVKDADNYLSLIVLGVFCGTLMFIASDGFKNFENPVSKVVAVFLPVMVFILSGFEHCIADMFYFSMANDFSFASMSALLVISIGNSIGGILIPVSQILTKKYSKQ